MGRKKYLPPPPLPPFPLVYISGNNAIIKLLDVAKDESCACVQHLF